MTKCNHEDVVNMDYWTGYKPGKGMHIANRVCRKCKMHWHGLWGYMQEYTKEEWDRKLVREDD